LIQKANFDFIEVITSVGPQVVNELEKIYGICLDLGVNNWRIMPIILYGRAALNKDNLSLSTKELKYVLDYIKEKRKTGKINVTLNEMWFCGPEYEFEVRNSGFFCQAGINILSILADGNVCGCPMLPYMSEGNIEKDDIMEMWERGFLKYRNIEWKKVGKCKNCESFDYCCGGEMHLWKPPYQEIEVCYNSLIKNQ